MGGVGHFLKNGVLLCIFFYLYINGYYCFALFFGWIVAPHAPHFFGVFLAESQSAQGILFHSFVGTMMLEIGVIF